MTQSKKMTRKASKRIRGPRVDSVATARLRKLLIVSRGTDVHKGDFGPVFVFGGCNEMPGAPNLTGMAAIKIGAGSVIISGPQLFWPELMKQGEQQLLGLISKSKAIVVGPGWGLRASTARLIKILQQRKSIPVVIDADALRLIAHPQFDRSLTKGTILTPHPGEAAALLRTTTHEIQNNREQAARELAEQYKAIVVLKGNHTIVTAPQSKPWINSSSSNHWMATAGSGDVLAGIIAGYLAQGVSPESAATRAVYAHGLAGDYAAQQGCVPISASDIIYALPQILAP